MTAYKITTHIGPASGYFSAKDRVAQWVGYVANRYNTDKLYLCAYDDIGLKFDTLGQAHSNIKRDPISCKRIVSWERGAHITLDDGTIIPMTENEVPYVDDNGNEIWDIEELRK